MNQKEKAPPYPAGVQLCGGLDIDFSFPSTHFTADRFGEWLQTVAAKKRKQCNMSALILILDQAPYHDVAGVCATGTTCSKSIKMWLEERRIFLLPLRSRLTPHISICDKYAFAPLKAQVRRCWGVDCPSILVREVRALLRAIPDLYGEKEHRRMGFSTRIGEVGVQYEELDQRLRQIIPEAEFSDRRQQLLRSYLSKRRTPDLKWQLPDSVGTGAHFQESAARQHVAGEGVDAGH